VAGKKKAGRRRGNGDGGLYWMASRNLWRAVVDNGYTADGRRRQLSATGRTAEIAREKLKEKLHEIDAFGAPIDKTKKVQDWAAQWLDTVTKTKLKPNAQASYESVTRNWITPVLGSRAVATLKPSDVHAMIKNVTDSGRSSSTALKAYNILSGMLEAARVEGLCSRNVAADVKPPSAATSNRGALTTDQALRILEVAAGKPGGTRWWVALLAGLRQSERLGARITSLYLDEADGTDTLGVEWQLDEIVSEHGCEARADGTWSCGKKRGAFCPQKRLKIPYGFEYEQLVGRLCLIRPKSGHSRFVPLIPALAAALRADIAAAESKPNPYGLIWRHDDGSPFLPGEDGQEWRDILFEAGLITEDQLAPGSEVPTTHWARHTTATVLMELGVDAKIIGEIVGHQSERITQRYQHVSSAAARDAMNKLGEHWAIGA
jgi:site-specific recombinase XerD